MDPTQEITVPIEENWLRAFEREFELIFSDTTEIYRFPSSEAELPPPRPWNHRRSEQWKVRTTLSSGFVLDSDPPVLADPVEVRGPAGPGAGTPSRTQPIEARHRRVPPLIERRTRPAPTPEAPVAATLTLSRGDLLMLQAALKGLLQAQDRERWLPRTAGIRRRRQLWHLSPGVGPRGVPRPRHAEVILLGLLLGMMVALVTSG